MFFGFVLFYFFFLFNFKKTIMVITRFNKQMDIHKDIHTMPVSPNGQNSKVNTSNISNIKIWSINIEGFSQVKLAELTHLMRIELPHIVLVQETWLKAERYSGSDIQIADYILY